MLKKNKHNPLKGVAAGIVAGGIAGAAMDGYWAVVQNLPGARPEQEPKPGDDHQEEKKPSTQIIADKISDALTGHEVPKKHKPVAGVGVHYALSVLCGGLFGGLAARIPRLGIIVGALYGAGIWLFLDEITLRVLRVAPQAAKVPAKEHIQALGAHIVYGSFTGAIARFLLK